MANTSSIPNVLFTTVLSEEQQDMLDVFTSFSYQSIPFIKVQALDSHLWSDDVPFETDAWVFTSKKAVEAVLPMRGLFIDPDLVFAVGEKTANEIKKYDLNPMVPDEFNVQALSQLITRFNPPELVHFCGNLKVESLTSLLSHTPIDVVNIPVYETTLTSHEISDISYDAVVFMSPSSITSFFQKNSLKSDIDIFCIGQTTAHTIEKWGFKNYHQASKSTFDSLVDSLQSFYS